MPEKQYRVEARRGSVVVKFKWITATSAEEACDMFKKDMLSLPFISDAAELEYVCTHEGVEQQ